MSKFERALDNVFEKRKKELGRPPSLDETETLRQQLFQEWLLSERFDELIHYIHWYYADDGGFGDCAILSEALRKKGDLPRIERLYSKLISIRTAQFWRVWPKANDGHIGAMRESSKFMAAAMEAYAGLWHGYWSLDDAAGKDRVRSEMLQLQERVRPRPGKHDRAIKQRRMDKAQFWKLIDRSRKAAEENPEQQLETLRDLLTGLSVEDIMAFDRILDEYHARADNWDLWGAAFLIGGGCSDDGFMDFRGWLISRGEKAYEEALVDPESLVRVVQDHDGICQVEGYQYIGAEVWAAKTGRPREEFPDHVVPERRRTQGTPWEEDELAQRFPKLAKKFG